MVKLPGSGFAVTPCVTSLLRQCVALKRAGTSMLGAVCQACNLDFTKQEENQILTKLCTAFFNSQWQNSQVKKEEISGSEEKLHAWYVQCSTCQSLDLELQALFWATQKRCVT